CLNHKLCARVTKRTRGGVRQKTFQEWNGSIRIGSSRRRVRRRRYLRGGCGCGNLRRGRGRGCVVRGGGCAATSQQRDTQGESKNQEDCLFAHAKCPFPMNDQMERMRSFYFGVSMLT